MWFQALLPRILFRWPQVVSTLACADLYSAKYTRETLGGPPGLGGSLFVQKSLQYSSLRTLAALISLTHSFISSTQIVHWSSLSLCATAQNLSQDNKQRQSHRLMPISQHHCSLLLGVPGPWKSLFNVFSPFWGCFRWEKLKVLRRGSFSNIKEDFFVF